MKRLLLSLALAPIFASGEDRVLSALHDRQIAEEANRLGTDDRIDFYSTLAGAQPETPHYQVLLAGSYIQKTRETTDFSYLERANKLLQAVLDADSSNYEALRLRLEVELERHEFKKVVELSRRLTEIAPQDAWNWGTLGDAYIELGEYEQAAEAYQRMVTIHPDLASYNRAAHYRFLMNDTAGAIDTMKLAIEAGSPSPENVAWCWVELGGYYFKTGRPAEAEQAYVSALRSFPNYHPALAALGRLQASKGESAKAIANLREAQSRTPLPEYAGALHDLYLASGRPSEAAKQKQLIEAIDQLGRASGEKANRSLAVILADHDWHLERALELATAELEVRGDVYTYDALAWALYKNGRLDEAAAASEKARKLQTPEPAFAEHASRIREAIEARARKSEPRERAMR